MSWIDDVLAAVDDAESPEIFKRWACIYSIASVLKKQVWLDKQGIYNLYPNLYIMIVANSGVGKSFPIIMAKKFIAEAGVRVISGQNSVQAVITELKTAYTLPNGGPPIIDAQASLLSGEFRNLLIDDPMALSILTELYNTHENEPDWTKNIKGSGKETLKNPCLSLLGATNEAMLNDIVGPRDVEGGFIARTIMVMAKDRGKINPLVDDDVESIPWKKLAEYLKLVAQVKGPFKWDPKARSHYKDWYHDWRSKSFNDPTGTVNRIHDTMLKVTMSIALSRHLDLVIYDDDLQDAMDEVFPLIANARQITSGSGKSTIAAQTKLVVEELLTAEEFCRTRAQLLSKYHGHMDSATLDQVIQTLTDAEIITNRKSRGKFYYQLTESFLKKYRKGVEEELDS